VSKYESKLQDCFKYLLTSTPRLLEPEECMELMDVELIVSTKSESDMGIV